MMIAILCTLAAAGLGYALHRARLSSTRHSSAFYRRAKLGQLVIAGEDEDLEQLMEESEAEVGALRAIQGDDESAATRAGLVKQTLELVKRRPLGFTGTNAITAGASVSFTAQVQRPIRINRLLLSPDAPGLVIDSVKMGDVEQALTPGIAAEVYGAEALADSVPDNFDPVRANGTVTVVIRNTTAGTINVTVGAKAAVTSAGA